MHLKNETPNCPKLDDFSPNISSFLPHVVGRTYVPTPATLGLVMGLVLVNEIVEDIIKTKV